MDMTAASSQFALDVNGLNRLKYSARTDSDEALKGAAKQFEAVFIQSMLKSMRDAIPKSDLFASSQSKLYQSMMDQQWSQTLSERGMGLADKLVAWMENQKKALETLKEIDLLADIPRVQPKQLHQFNPVPATAVETPQPSAALAANRDKIAAEPFAPARVAPEKPTPTGAVRPADLHNSGAGASFLAMLTEPASNSSQKSGIPAELMLAQAVLETGWGKHQITTENGSNSHNLFGIKAGASWTGKVTTVTTHEYVGNQRIVMKDQFRVYDSYEAAFDDYAALIGGSERYRGVLEANSPEQAARALQHGGYATDPKYAEKLISLIERSRAARTSG